MTISKDYHDYVFKDGKLVGKFDEMYKHSSEIPWHQDKTAYAVFSNIDMAILRQFKYDSICEIGCGLGYFTNRLHKELTSTGGGRPQVTGIDISNSAIEKASKQFPDIRFITGNLTISDERRPMNDKQYDLIVIKEVLWYVCHQLDRFLQNIINLIKDDGFLYVSQSFPESDKWVGKEIIDSPERLKEIFIQYARPIHYCIEQDWNYKGRALVHYLGRVVKNENK